MDISFSIYNEKLAKFLFKQGIHFLAIYDLSQQRYVRVNPAGVRQLGYTSEQALLEHAGLTLRSHVLIDEERLQRILHLEQFGHFHQETTIQRVNGDTFWARVVVSTYADQLVLVQIIDQDRLHQTERELKHITRRNEAIFSDATIGIVVCDSTGKIVSANQLADHLFGFNTGEMLGLMVEQLVPWPVRMYHQKQRQTYNSAPQIRPMGLNRDLLGQRKDGSVFPVEVSLSYFWQDEDLFNVAYIIDNTFKRETAEQLLEQKKQVEQLNVELEQRVIERTNALLDTLKQLEKSKAELDQALTTERELSELKSRLVSMASHEFRTPLTAVLNATALLEKYTDEKQQDKRQKHLDLIKTSVKHLIEILEEFLSLGKLEEGKIMAQAKSVNLAKLLNDTVAEMQN